MTFLFLAVMMGSCVPNANMDKSLFRFVVLGDSRGNYHADPPVYLEVASLQKITGQILALNPQPRLVIFNGDMVAKTTYEKAPDVIKQWQDIFLKPLQARGISVYIVPGNHIVDTRGQNSNTDVSYISQFRKYYMADNPSNGPLRYEGVTYSFNEENVHFSTATPFTTHDGWDNTEIAPKDYFQKKKNWEYFMNRENRAWLRQDLKNNTAEFDIFFVHLPLYPTGPHYKDKKGFNSHPANRDALARILTDNKVDIVFAAHEHLYARTNLTDINPDNSSLKGNLVQVVSGAAGAPFSQVGQRGDMGFEKYLPAVHFVVGDVNKENILFNVYDIKNQLIDSFGISRQEK
ncbi:MAG: hypothetical protein GY710_00520 [Desulfobacteraceae bacterium]|nr:hypothetical protein [Desulfobacteraceae bacterium]